MEIIGYYTPSMLLTIIGNQFYWRSAAFQELQNHLIAKISGAERQKMVSRSGMDCDLRQTMYTVSADK